jgi:hypothetical protein
MKDSFLSALKKAVVLGLPLVVIFLVWQFAVTPLLDLHRDLDDAAERNVALLQRYRFLGSQEGETKAALLRLSEENSSEE